MVKNILSKVKIKGRKLRRSLVALSMLMVATSSQVFAEPQTVQEFSGSAIDLANDVFLALLVIIPIAAAAAIGFQALMKILNQDPAEVSHRNKLIKAILIAAVIGECASGIIKAILVYVGH